MPEEWQPWHRAVLVCCGGVCVLMQRGTPSVQMALMSRAALWQWDGRATLSGLDDLAGKEL
eukprot:6237080-Ditylum_brightwellii.AAC.1